MSRIPILSCVDYQNLSNYMTQTYTQIRTDRRRKVTEQETVYNRKSWRENHATDTRVIDKFKNFINDGRCIRRRLMKFLSPVEISPREILVTFLCIYL